MRIPLPRLTYLEMPILRLVTILILFCSAATEAVFKSNSTAPAATLKDAYEEFEKNSPKSDELIRDIGEDLTVAIDNVIDAAAMEFDPQQCEINFSNLIGFLNF